MKTTKLFFMAALALMTAACSNDDNEITQQTQKGGGITITAQLAPKTNGAATRAVSDQTTFIKSEWAVGELIAILYKVGSTNKVTNAEIKTVDINTGVATIEFTVDGNTADNTACTLVYPAELTDNTTQTPTTTPTYKEDLSGLKDDVELLALANQDGMLNTNMDVRKGEGTIQTSTPSLTVTTQPAAQFSIFKFSIQDINGNSKNAAVFKVNKKVDDTTEKNIFTFTHTTGDGISGFYYALPVLSAGTYWFSAMIDEKPYVAKATIATATVKGKYYPTTVTMATVGDVVLSTGKFAKAGTDGAVAMIACVVEPSDVGANSHGLALALADENNGLELPWSDAIGICNGKNTSVAVDDAFWMLPSLEQWESIIGGATGVNLSAKANLLTLEYTSDLILYWSSTEYDDSNVYVASFYTGTCYTDTKAAVTPYRRVCRACLAF